MFSFLLFCLAASAFAGEPAFHGNLTVTPNPAPAGPSLGDYSALNNSMGDVRSILNGGTSQAIRDRAERTSQVIQNSFNEAQALQAKISHLAEENRKSIALTPPPPPPLPDVLELARQARLARAVEWSKANLAEVQSLRSETLADLAQSAVAHELGREATEYLNLELDRSEAGARAALEQARAGHDATLARALGTYAKAKALAIRDYVHGVYQGIFHGVQSRLEAVRMIFTQPHFLQAAARSLFETISHPFSFAKLARDKFIYAGLMTLSPPRGATAAELGMIRGALAVDLLSDLASLETAGPLGVEMGMVAAEVTEAGVAPALAEAIVVEARASQRLADSLAEVDREATRVAELASRHGIEFSAGGKVTKVDRVLLETLERQGDFTSKFSLTADEALQAGERWVGKNYREVGRKPGIFQSRDGIRQFRIDDGSLTGAHSPHVPHVHFESRSRIGEKFSSNNHVIYKD